jgi:hypothetical protein
MAAMAGPWNHADTNPAPLTDPGRTQYDGIEYGGLPVNYAVSVISDESTLCIDQATPPLRM